MKAKNIRLLVKLCRPHQWTKNLLVFAGVVFAQRFTETRALVSAFTVFAGFCFTASGLYVLNDIFDRDHDLHNDRKRKRPIASGEVSVRTGLWLVAILLPCGLALCFLAGMRAGLTCLAYALTVSAYSLWLKHIVLLDVLVISAGFVLRAVAGAVAIPVEISPWLLICTLLLAMFLSLGKRRQELVLLNNAENHRKVLSHYTRRFLDQMITIVASATLVAYCVYTVDPETVRKFHTHLMPLTIPFVLYGIFRYLYLVHKHQEGESPSRTLFTDPPLLINIVLWGSTCVAIILLSRP